MAYAFSCQRCFEQKSKHVRITNKLRRQMKTKEESERPFFISILDHFQTLNIFPKFKCDIVEIHSKCINLPISVRPEGGKIPHNRLWRKTLQVENMIEICSQVLQNMNLNPRVDSKSYDHRFEALKESNPSRRIRVVEFCSGSGFVALPLAALYPEIDVILIDQKGCVFQQHISISFNNFPTCHF